MANLEGIAIREARADRKFQIAAQAMGSEDQLEKAYVHMNRNTFDPDEKRVLAKEAFAELFLAASGAEYEESDLNEPEHKTQAFNVQTGEAEEKKLSAFRVLDVNASSGQGPLPEDAKPGDKLGDDVAEGQSAASDVSEEEREKMVDEENTPKGPDSKDEEE